jgi:serine/threonine protein kinase
LIYTEFATRYQLGQTPVADEYLQRFPNWRDRLTRLFEIHHLFSPDLHTVIDSPCETPFPSSVGRIQSGRGSARGTLGRYEILSELGRGAMGVVYAARQVGLDRIVALKVVPLGPSDAQPVADGPVVNRFANEAKTLASLQHPNIVQVYDVGVDGLMGHLAMELVDCGNLTRKLAAGVPPVKWSAELMIQLAVAVAYAHARGVTHRDLKPANILLTSAGEPKIADFGLAKCCATEGGQTTTGAIVGTPSYMAPEQAAGDVNIGPAADIYS